MQSLTLLETRLADHGQSLTQARKLIFLLFTNQPYISIDQVLSLVSANINRATAYRTVALFEELDILGRLYVAKDAYLLGLQEPYIGHHHVFLCVNCSEVATFSEPAFLPDVLRAASKKIRGSVRSHELVLRGVCARCDATRQIKT